jgi:hypothetical protein
MTWPKTQRHKYVETVPSLWVCKLGHLVFGHPTVSVHSMPAVSQCPLLHYHSKALTRYNSTNINLIQEAICYDLHPRGDGGKRNHFGGSNGTVEGLRHSNHAVVTWLLSGEHHALVQERVLSSEQDPSANDWDQHCIAQQRALTRLILSATLISI